MTAAAQHLRVSRQLLSELVNEARASPLIWRSALPRRFGSTTEPWLDLQMAYDLSLARHRLDDIKVERIMAT